MAVRPLVFHPNPILRQRAKRVTTIDDSIRRLVADMLETMPAANGVGLAAPQIGVSLRVIVFGMPEEERFVLLNPEVVRRSGQRRVTEGCLSVPGYRGEITRSLKVVVKGLNLEGRQVRVRAEDNLLAQALEHEIDHLNGVLYLDHLERPEDLEKVEPEEEEEEEPPPEQAAASAARPGRESRAGR